MSSSTPQQWALSPRQISSTGPYAPGYQIAILVQALTSPIASIAILIVLLLLTLRIVKRRGLRGTEYALIAALVLDIGVWVESLVYVQGATANWLSTNLSVNDLVRLLKIIYAWNINYHAAKVATEIAILYMLKDTFKLETRGFKYSWLATLGLTILCGVVAVIVDLARCTPVQANWDFTVPAKCLDGQAVIIGTNAAVGAPSVLILLLSFVQIIRDGVSWKVKLLMLLYWIIGFLIVILCLPTVIISLAGTVQSSSSFSSDIPTTFIVSVWEVSVGIMWAAIPGIVQVLRKPKGDGNENSPPTERRWYGRRNHAQT